MTELDIRFFKEYHDTLKNYSLVEFNAYIKALSEIISFTPDDTTDINTIRRRIANRESARKSRQKRQKELLDLKNTNKRLHKQNRQLKVENARLKRIGFPTIKCETCTSLSIGDGLNL